MARRNKLLKFTELLTFPNVYENFDPDTDDLVHYSDSHVKMASKWHSDHFKNQKPICLELACGRGEYTLDLARRYPEKNFIGVDIKGARIWKGASIALKEGLVNVAFLRTKIEFITQFLGKDEVDEIWITFPDPFLKSSKYNRRLTSPVFLDRYAQLLKPGAPIHLKTDSDELFEHTLEVLQEQGIKPQVVNDDIYSGKLPHPDLDIPTYYERMHLQKGKTIKYIRFELNYSLRQD